MILIQPGDLRVDSGRWPANVERLRQKDPGVKILSPDSGTIFLPCIFLPDPFAHRRKRWQKNVWQKNPQGGMRGVGPRIFASSAVRSAFQCNAVNRVTNMTDSVGATRFAYTTFGALSSEDGPWVNDTVNYFYNVNLLRSAFTLAQGNDSPWIVTYEYDAGRRLSSLSGRAGTFTYAYLGAGTLVTNLSARGIASTTNAYDSVGRLLRTALKIGVNPYIPSFSV
jgi:YD repeat-containing protein